MKSIDLLPIDFVGFCVKCDKIITQKDVKKKLAMRINRNQYRHINCRRIKWQN